MAKLVEVNSRDVRGLDQLGLPSIELFLPFRATGVPDTQCKPRHPPIVRVLRAECTEIAR